MDREALESLGREELVLEARRIGVQRPEVMTRVELVDEVLRVGTPNPVERKEVRGWLGVARDLLASAIELGLNLPDAAALIRGDIRFEPLRPEQRPVATVTLAEIYGAQGHFDRALGMLDEVLAREPEHEAAQRLRARLGAERESRLARQRKDEGGIDVRRATPVPEEPGLDDDEPEPLTLAPASLEAHVLGEYDDGDHVTLIPARPEPHALEEDDEPDHVTLVPARPDAHVLEEEEPDHATLIPAARTSWPDAPPPVSAEDGPDLPTLPPSSPVVEESEPPTLLPSRSHAHDTDPGIAGPSLPVPAEAPPPGAAPEPVRAYDPGIVITRVGPGSAVVYFEVGNLVFDDGHVAVVRVVEHRPRLEGVERVERDMPVAGAAGITTVLDLEEGSFVRAALGRKYDGQFVPAAVAAEVSVIAGAVDIGWAPRRSVDYAALIGRSRIAERVVSG